MNTINILVIEDEDDIREILEQFLSSNNYNVDLAVDGLDGYEKFKANKYDLLIMDIMMPKIDGFTLAEMIRKQSQVPIIMLTALDDENDQLKGFDLVIDDYITKPFSIKLLLKRVENVLRKSTFSTNSNIEYDKIRINISTSEVYVEDQLITLTIKEYELLLYLLSNGDKVISRQELLEKIWEYDYFGDIRVVDTHIKNLRKKLGYDCIETIRGRGYRIAKENKE